MTTTKVFKLEVLLENEAFQPTRQTCCDELARILRRFAERAEEGHPLDNRPLFDVNGNCVGWTKVVKRREA